MPQPVAALRLLLAELTNHAPGDALRRLVEAGFTRLPLPGAGATLTRWQMLATVGAHDLSLVKLYEGHTDAIAILAELDGPPVKAGELWGVWCAESPGARLLASAPARAGELRLRGRKAWCSGAAVLTHTLVSCWDEQAQAALAALDLRQPGVHVTDQGWHAVGMAGSASVDVDFDAAAALAVGAAGDYVRRPGFWHGGAGVAACWYGAATAIARRLPAQLRTAEVADPHRCAQLGAIDVALRSAAALLHEAAHAIDREPARDAMALALRARLGVEAAATQVLTLATRALGAAPLCREPEFARRVADLPVFLRQSHAERDLAALGATLLHDTGAGWDL